MTMPDARTLPPLVILDPGNFTPLYDMNLAAALAKRGWQPCWVTSSHQFDDPPVLQGIQVTYAFYRFLHWHWMKFPRSVPALRRLAKVAAYPLGLMRLSMMVSTMRPGILHVQWALLPPLDRLFWHNLRRRGWVVVFTAHEPRPLAGTLPDGLARCRYQLWAAPDAVVVHGTQAARTLRQAGIPEERVHILPPGPPAIPTGITRAEARLALGIPTDERVILFLGYIKPYKGLDILLQSLPLVKKNLGRVQCLVAGECMDSRTRYKDLIAKCKLEQEVRWFDGYLPESMVPAYFAACDVVALPYLDAAHSGVLLSAYAFGRPVVATAVGGNTELVEDGRSGLLVRPGDPVALAAALNEALQEPETARRMGARGEEKLRLEYSWERIAECTERLYRLLLSGKHR